MPHYLLIIRNFKEGCPLSQTFSMGQKEAVTILLGGALNSGYLMLKYAGGDCMRKDRADTTVTTLNQ